MVSRHDDPKKERALFGCPRPKESRSSHGPSDHNYSDTNDAMRKFYSFIGRLENEVQEKSEPLLTADFDADVSIDLNHLLENQGKDIAIRPPSPIHHRKNRVVQQKTNDKESINSTFHVTKKQDPTTDELENIVEVLKKKNHYSCKLATRMLRGLKQTLSNEVYQLFITDKLPGNFLPIVRMNSDNTPYIEFLVKSDDADQDPASQLSDFNLQQIGLSKFIVQCLCEAYASDNEATDSNNSRPLQSHSQQQRIQQPPKPKPVQLKPNHSKPTTPMACSTPKAVKRSLAAPSIKENLNDSKRILPHRSCKSKSSLCSF